MALDDVVSPEVGAAVAITAVAFSPKARNIARRGLVYGLAGLIRLGDAAANAAKGVGQGVQGVAASAGQTAGQVANEARGRASGEPNSPVGGATDSEETNPAPARAPRRKA